MHERIKAQKIDHEWVTKGKEKQMKDETNTGIKMKIPTNFSAIISFGF